MMNHLYEQLTALKLTGDLLEIVDLMYQRG